MVTDATALRAPGDSEPDSDTFRWVLAALFGLNAFDAIATMFWVTSGLAVEANPLMAHLLEVHPLAFVLVKFALLALGIAVLWRRREHPLSRFAGFALLFVYVGIALYHVEGVAMAM